MPRKGRGRPGFAARWTQIEKELPKEAGIVSELAQKILAMDRITPEGVGLAARSEELQELKRLLENSQKLRDALGVSHVSAQSVLFVLDTFATDILFSHERS